MDKNITQQNKELVNTLPSEFGKTFLARVIFVYQMLWYDTFGTKYSPNWGMVGKMFNSFTGPTEWQIAALFIVHFNWYGGSGDDHFIYKRLADQFFPINWVPSKENEYSTFLTNHEDVNYGDKESIYKYVREYIGPIFIDLYRRGIIIKNKEGVYIFK